MSWSELWIIGIRDDGMGPDKRSSTEIRLNDQVFETTAACERSEPHSLNAPCIRTTTLTNLSPGRMQREDDREIHLTRLNLA